MDVSRFDPDDSRWLYMRCQHTGCDARAVGCLLEEDMWLCFDCFEEWLERVEAISAAPALRELLPSWDDR